MSDQAQQERVVDVDQVKDYLREYYAEHHKLPSIVEMAERFEVSPYKMNEVFRILVHEGFLRRNFSRYRMVERRPETVVEEEPPTPMVVYVGRWQVTVIRAVMAVAGLAAAIVSGFFAVLRLEEFMPSWLAVVCGFFMVAFAVIAFEAVLVFVYRRQMFLAGVFVFLWVLVLVFTLMASVGGFYNYYAGVRHQRVVASGGEEAKRVELQSVRSHESALLDRVASLSKQLASMEAIVADASTSVERRAQYGRVFYDAQTRIVSLQDQMDRAQASLEVDRQKEASLLSATPAAAQVVRADFFTWVGGMLHVSPDSLELSSALFPSIFIDLIASIGLAVALFLSESTTSQQEKDMKKSA